MGDPPHYSASQIPSVDVEKLVFFGASVFWRGTLNGWKIEQQTTDFISLGTKYEEQFRQYLMNEKPFPKDAIIRVSLSNAPRPFRGANFLRGERLKEHGYHYYRFAIPGMVFNMAVGKAIPAIERRICTLRSPEKFIAIADNVDQQIIQDGLWDRR